MNSTKNNKNKYSFVFLTLLIVIGYFFIIRPDISQKSKEISYSDFINMVESKQVGKVEISNSLITIYPKDETSKQTYETQNIKNDNLTETLLENQVEFKGIDESTNLSDRLWALLLNFGPFLVIGYFLYLGFKSMDQSLINAKKGNYEFYDVDDDVKVSFEDVAGQDEAKESLNEIVDYLHNPHKYKQIGAKLPKGCLLVGPPGTGKTLLAKAIAGESKVPFLSISGSDFVEMFVGVGASRVRDLFAKAKEFSPCIVFIDEIDAIGKNRDNKFSNNDEREQTLNQLLKEMDGFNESTGIVIIGATNRPEVLDKALLRPGRFDRQITVDVPDLQGRISIFKVYTSKISIKNDIDYHELGLATMGASGADIANIVNESALLAVRNGNKFVTQDDLLESIETVIAGKQKKNHQVIKKERKIVAVHEVGHALISTKLKGENAVRKITIIPRTLGSLGYTLNFPDEEKNLSSKEDFLKEITILLGGRASEEIILKNVTNGCSNDLQRATKIARQMVTMYGLSKMGMVCYEESRMQFLEGETYKNYSDMTSLEIDKNIKLIIDYCYDVAKQIILSNKKIIAEAGNLLLKEETINNEQFIEVYNEYINDIDVVMDETKYYNKFYSISSPIINNLPITQLETINEKQNKPKEEKIISKIQESKPKEIKPENKETIKDTLKDKNQDVLNADKNKLKDIKNDVSSEKPSLNKQEKESKPVATSNNTNQKKNKNDKKQQSFDFDIIMDEVNKQNSKKKDTKDTKPKDDSNENKKQNDDKKIQKPTPKSIFESLQENSKTSSFKPKPKETKKTNNKSSEIEKDKQVIEIKKEENTSDIINDEELLNASLIEDESDFNPFGLDESVIDTNIQDSSNEELSLEDFGDDGDEFLPID